MAEKIQATLVLEILGRPAEHVKEALDNIVKRLGEEKGVKVIEKTFHEPILVKDSKDLFTAFVEVTATLDSLENYFGILFAYMPAHIEISSPESLGITNTNLNELGNKILMRLHDYDAITKKTLYEREILARELHKYAPHLFKKAEAPATAQSESPKKKQKPKIKKSKK